ncbi:MAG: Guanosine polyphosphate pyrophosphohydrolase/synthetase [Pseudomonadota bacterium]|jgi:(p)ppGpp synthase/HD superfamily hydrolase
MTQNKYTLEPCIYSDSLLNKLAELNITAVKYKCDQVDITYIKKGLSFAKYYHGQQMRKSGEPYYSHPIIVAEMVSNHMFRENPIIAALLHDTLEDTTLTLSEIEQEFNPRIAQIVDRLTRKIDPATGKKMSAGECLLKAHELGDMESMLIKMYDRWHNVTTIDSMSKEKQEKIARETLDYFLILNTYLQMSNEKKESQMLIINSKLHQESNEIISRDDFLILSLGLQNTTPHKQNLP